MFCADDDMTVTCLNCVASTHLSSALPDNSIRFEAGHRLSSRHLAAHAQNKAATSATTQSQFQGGTDGHLQFPLFALKRHNRSHSVSDFTMKEESFSGFKTRPTAFKINSRHNASKYKPNAFWTSVYRAIFWDGFDINIIGAPH